MAAATCFLKCPLFFEARAVTLTENLFFSWPHTSLFHSLGNFSYYLCALPFWQGQPTITDV